MEGKRILVVGASSGVGAATARLAVERGARVAISARRADILEAMCAASVQMVALPADVRDGRAARRVVDEAVIALGGLDAVVYAVGMSPRSFLWPKQPKNSGEPSSRRMSSARRW